MRRVVTGQTDAGKSVFVSDDQIEPIRLSLMPGLEFTRVWGGDETASLPDRRHDLLRRMPSSRPSAATASRSSRSRPRGRRRCPRISTVDGVARREVDAKLPGMLEHNELENPGMHTTDTVDLDLVLSGEMDLELDDGAEVHLRPGDCVVQNGTRHAWRNRSSEPCTMLSILVGARRS